VDNCYILIKRIYHFVKDIIKQLLQITCCNFARHSFLLNILLCPALCRALSNFMSYIDIIFRLHHVCTILNGAHIAPLRFGMRVSSRHCQTCIFCNKSLIKTFKLQSCSISGYEMRVSKKHCQTCMFMYCDNINNTFLLTITLYTNYYYYFYF
jgi:hypothetical protein